MINVGHRNSWAAFKMGQREYEFKKSMETVKSGLSGPSKKHKQLGFWVS